MSVRSILNEKGRSVLTTSSDVTIGDAAKQLHAHHVGALIIIDEGGHIVGIVAERDIVAAIARSGAACLTEPVSSIMWTNVYRCSEDMSVPMLMAMMSEHRARHIPVETDGHLAGIISIGDVVKAHIRHIEREAEQIKAYIAG